MDNERIIYNVIYPSNAKFAVAEAVDPQYNYGKFDSCPSCGGRVSGCYWVEKREIMLNKNKLPDFLYIYGGANIPFLVSERALAVLKENEISGILKFEPVDAVRLKKEVLDVKYYILTLKRELYPINHERSKIVYGDNPHARCRVCNPIGRTKDIIAELYFKSDVTVTQDIFKIYDLGDSVFLSERFTDVCLKNGLTGLYYVNMKELYKSEKIFSMNEIQDMLDAQRGKLTNEY